MIDKKIFYCWFGPDSNMKPFNKRCIESWKKQCPDYEIIRIDEKVFNPAFNDYTDLFYQKGNYAFVSDVARIEILKENSGFYLDTDMQLFHSLDKYRSEPSVMLESYPGYVGTALIGCQNGLPSILEKSYERLDLRHNMVYYLNEELYKTHDYKGLEIERFKDFSVIGNKYASYTNDLKPLSDDVFIFDHQHNSWVNTYKADMKVAEDFLEFDIKLKSETIKAQNPVGSIEVFKLGYLSKETLAYYAGVGNYLKNPRILEIESDDFRIRRYTEIDKSKVTIYTNSLGFEVTHLK